MQRLIVIGALCLVAARADAYPQFQLSTGAVRCNQCHYAPAGGGLINGYGRSEAGDSISMGGDGGFLHGLWTPPSWLALGGDFRGAAIARNNGATEGLDATVFPMQADLYARGQVGPMSLYLTVGLRGAVYYNDPPPLSLFESREHYLMWRPRNTGPYLRAGRFFAPYGLRLAEHPTYVRRWLGFNTYEETYNVSGGYVTDAWELHATAFTPDFLRPLGLRRSGGAASYERRFGDRAVAGAQALVGKGPDELAVQGGVVGKYFLSGPRLMFMAQLDLVHQSFDDLDDPRWQNAVFLGASWTFMRGFVLTGMLERWDEDLAVKGVARSSLGGHLQWFPTAHVEVSLFSKLQIFGTGSSSDGDAAETVLLQVHYYL